MTRENYNVIGVMSGTSLDGVDFAHISFTIKENRWYFSLKECGTFSYSDVWVGRLREAVGFDESELHLLNKEYTLLLGGMIRDFMKDNGIASVDAVCSHGHTILHRPQYGITLQIGNLPEIAGLTGERVVCDFRVQDVKLGGQGAPLVPIGDRLLFADYDYCLNLGGFSNISFEEGSKRIAFDISPVNTVLNHYARLLGYDYDNGGTLAASGTIIMSLLDELNSLDYYKQPYPKSLGFEFVKEVVLPIIERYEESPRDKLRTFSEHVAIQIAKVLQDKRNGKMLVTGGGAYNAFLLKRMKELLPDKEIIVPGDKVIQFKEALIFALLGVLKLRNENNVLSSVTGASHDHCSGVVYEP